MTVVYVDVYDCDDNDVSDSSSVAAEPVVGNDNMRRRLLLLNQKKGIDSRNNKCTKHSSRSNRGAKRLSQVSLPRMVHRDLPFHQSTNSMSVKNTARYSLLRLMIMDWFHTLLRCPAAISITFLLLLWISLVAFYGVIYWFVDNHYYNSVDCGLGPTEKEFISLSGAFAFSLETCTTVGCKYFFLLFNAMVARNTSETASV